MRTMMAAVAATMISVSAGADVVYSNLADAMIMRSDQSGFFAIVAGTTTHQVGLNGGIMYTTVIPFALPPRPEGSVVSSASLTVVALRNQHQPEMAIDLYGLTPRSEPTVIAEDEYFGPFDESEGATLIQAAYIDVENTNIVELVRTDCSPEGQAALADYLNDAYDTIGEGGFVFLRLSSNNATPPNLHFYFVWATEFNFPPGGWNDRRPYLTIEFSEVAACAADLNGDGVVDGADLASLLSNWGPNEGAADLTGDGVVNGADLANLLSGWGACGG